MKAPRGRRRERESMIGRKTGDELTARCVAAAATGATSTSILPKGGKELDKRHRRRLFAAALAACLVVAGVPAIAAAWPISPDYSWYRAGAQTFELNDANDVLGFIDLVNGEADIDGDGNADPAVSFFGATVKMTSDISLRNYDIVPIGGSDNKVFEGTFDGQGHTLSAFNVVRPEGAQPENLALFGHTGETSTVKNLVVDSASLNVMAINRGETIKNIGIVGGYMEGSLVNCTTVNCQLALSHTQDATAQAPFAVMNAGGMAGLVAGDVTGNVNGTSVNVGTSGRYASNGEWQQIVQNVGGVVGSAGDVDWHIDNDTQRRHGQLTNNTNNGNISVITPVRMGAGTYSDDYTMSGAVGGIAGYARGDASYLINNGNVVTDQGTNVGGIIGSYRCGRSVGFALDDKADEGVQFGETITLLKSHNKGNVAGRNVVGGVTGGAGSSTVIKGCLNGRIDVSNADDNNYVNGHRDNKPHIGGVCGRTLGVVTLCQNAGNVAAATYNDDGSFAAPTLGYYAGGIVGGAYRHTITGGYTVTYVENCLNTGMVRGKVRYRAIAGNIAEGYLTSCFALEGTADGSLAYDNMRGNNAIVPAADLRANNFLPKSDKTPLGILNEIASVDDGVFFAMAPSAEINYGYPVLACFLDTDPASLLNLADATFVEEVPAAYTGMTGSIPTISGLHGETKLAPFVDFLVIPQEDAVNQTPEGQAPYTATLVGIGRCTGTATVHYGINGAGTLEGSLISIETQQFNWEYQPLTKDMVKVVMGVDEEGNDVVVDPSEWEIATDLSTVAKARRGYPGVYNIEIAANPESEIVKGIGTGVFTIKPASLRYDEAGRQNGTIAYATSIEYPSADKAVDWQSQRTLESDEQGVYQNVAVTFPYTGDPIMPEVAIAYRGGGSRAPGDR